MKNPQQLIDGYRSMEQSLATTIGFIKEYLPDTVDEMKKLMRELSDLGDTVVALLNDNGYDTPEMRQAITEVKKISSTLGFYLTEIRVETKILYGVDI